jgi:hypothetical protein
MSRAWPSAPLAKLASTRSTAAIVSLARVVRIPLLVEPRSALLHLLAGTAALELPPTKLAPLASGQQRSLLRARGVPAARTTTKPDKASASHAKLVSINPTKKAKRVATRATLALQASMPVRSRPPVRSVLPAATVQQGRVSLPLVMQVASPQQRPSRAQAVRRESSRARKVELGVRNAPSAPLRAL